MNSIVKQLERDYHEDGCAHVQLYLSTGYTTHAYDQKEWDLIIDHDTISFADQEGELHMYMIDSVIAYFENVDEEEAA